MTLVQEAMSIMEAMPRRNQQIVLELLRAMSSQPTFREKPEKSANKQLNVQTSFYHEDRDLLSPKYKCEKRLISESEIEYNSIN